MIRTIAAVLLVLIVVLGCALNLLLGVGGNLGLKFGYYGKLNHVSEYLSSVPGIKIVDVGLHIDFTLEDFWIFVETCSGEVELQFLNANIRSKEDLVSGVEPALVDIAERCSAGLQNKAISSPSAAIDDSGTPIGCVSPDNPKDLGTALMGILLPPNEQLKLTLALVFRSATPSLKPSASAT